MSEPNRSERHAWPYILTFALLAIGLATAFGLSASSAEDVGSTAIDEPYQLSCGTATRSTAHAEYFGSIDGKPGITEQRALDQMTILIAKEPFFKPVRERLVGVPRLVDRSPGAGDNPVTRVKYLYRDASGLPVLTVDLRAPSDRWIVDGWQMCVS